MQHFELLLKLVVKGEEQINTEGEKLVDAFVTSYILHEIITEKNGLDEKKFKSVYNEGILQISDLYLLIIR